MRDPPPDSYGPERDPLACVVDGCEDAEELVATPEGPMCPEHADALLDVLRTPAEDE